MPYQNGLIDTGSESQILDEQAEYYRARAAEYDGWFLRLGRYDRGERENARWFVEVDEVRGALDRLPLDGGEVLELAPGTGLWTDLLVDRAARLVAVDSSPEMIEENRRRLGDRARLVSYEVADLFAWAPRREFDAVVFCFWISHVPDAILDAFLGRVASWLRPGGSLFFLDSRREPSSTARDHTLPAPDHEVMVRRLDDGREFRIVKNFWDADALVSRCWDAGLDITVHETATYFQYGIGTRR